MGHGFKVSPASRTAAAARELTSREHRLDRLVTWVLPFITWDLGTCPFITCPFITTWAAFEACDYTTGFAALPALTLPVENDADSCTGSWRQAAPN
jgi:hypothetical protein